MEQALFDRWLDRFAAKASRPWRLAVITFLISLIFPGTRFYLLAVIFIVAAVKAVQCGIRRGKWSYAIALSVALIIAGDLYAIAAAEAYKVAKYRRSLGESVPLNLDGGIYEGVADGARGPVHVKIVVGSGEEPGEPRQLKGIYAPPDLQRETGSIGGNALNELNRRYAAFSQRLKDLNAEISKRRLDHAIDSIDAITGATLTSRAYKKAVKTAIEKAQKDAVKMSAFSAATYFFLKNEISKISLNTLAIIFILVVFLDNTLQGILVRGTGQSVSCMNCQTCVGACPVKRVEVGGKTYAFPMDMVLYTRLGDYYTVRELARFCVGCARCTGKCPIGISAPSVASAAIRFLRERKAEERANAPGAANAGGGDA